jgi:hypothetical protein
MRRKARTYLLIWMLSANCLILSSCAMTRPEIIYKNVPEGYVVVSKEALAGTLQSCERCKSELLDCLGKLPPK